MLFYLIANNLEEKHTKYPIDAVMRQEHSLLAVALRMPRQDRCPMCQRNPRGPPGVLQQRADRKALPARECPTATTRSLPGCRGRAMVPLPARWLA
jgi:hypothetical protein